METKNGIVGAVVQATVGRAVNTHLTKHDAAERERLLASGPSVLVSEYTIAQTSFLATIMSFVVRARFLLYFLYSFIGVIYLFVGLGPEETIGSVLWFFLEITLFYVGTTAVIGALYYLKQRSLVRYVPFGLFTRRFSFVRELIINHEGIDGFFALPWKRVSSLTRPEANILVFEYKWGIEFLTKKLGINKTQIVFTNSTEADQVEAFYLNHKAQSH